MEFGYFGDGGVTGKISDGFKGAAAEAECLAHEIGSNAADAILFVAKHGEELPFVGPMSNMLQAIGETTETVKSNRKELIAPKEGAPTSRHASSSSVGKTPLRRWR